MALDDNDKTWIRGTIIEALETIVLPRFDEHDKRFDEHDRRFDEHDKRFDALEADVSELKEDVRILKSDMRQVKTSLDTLEGKVQALEADIKEVYLMQARLERANTGDKKFAKLSLEKKLLRLNSDLLATAREAGITLPR